MKVIQPIRIVLKGLVVLFAVLATPPGVMAADPEPVRQGLMPRAYGEWKASNIARMERGRNGRHYFSGSYSIEYPKNISIRADYVVDAQPGVGQAWLGAGIEHSYKTGRELTLYSRAKQARVKVRSEDLPIEQCRALANDVLNRVSRLARPWPQDTFFLEPPDESSGFYLLNAGPPERYKDGQSEAGVRYGTLSSAPGNRSVYDDALVITIDAFWQGQPDEGVALPDNVMWQWKEDGQTARDFERQGALGGELVRSESRHAVLRVKGSYRDGDRYVTQFKTAGHKNTALKLARAMLPQVEARAIALPRETPSQPEPPAEPVGTLAASGTVTLIRGEEEIAVNGSIDVRPGDRIVTGEDGMVSITYFSPHEDGKPNIADVLPGSTFTVGAGGAPESVRGQLVRPASDDGPVTVVQLEGTMRWHGDEDTPPWKRIIILGNVMVNLEGTDVMVSHKKGGATEIHVYRGKVSVDGPKGQRMQIEAGTGVGFDADGEMSPLYAFNKQTIAKMIAAHDAKFAPLRRRAGTRGAEVRPAQESVVKGAPSTPQEGWQRYTAENANVSFDAPRGWKASGLVKGWDFQVMPQDEQLVRQGVAIGYRYLKMEPGTTPAQATDYVLGMFSGEHAFELIERRATFLAGMAGEYVKFDVTYADEPDEPYTVRIHVVMNGQVMHRIEGWARTHRADADTDFLIERILSSFHFR